MPLADHAGLFYENNDEVMRLKYLHQFLRILIVSFAGECLHLLLPLDQRLHRHVVQLAATAELGKGGMLAEDASVILVPAEFLPNEAVVDVVVHQFARHLGALL